MRLKYKKIILTTIITAFFLTAGMDSSNARLIEGSDDKPPSTVSVLEPVKKFGMRHDRLDDRIIFKYGDVSWLPGLASQAGWPKNTHELLAEIVLRESGGCPNRRGGDAVDGNCNITHVTEWNHRSDTGLLQINGLNYDISRNKWAAVCTQMKICTQKPLLDPLTNLKAGKLLYDLSGWSPWDPCAWGPRYAHRCDTKTD